MNTNMIDVSESGIYRRNNCSGIHEPSLKCLKRFNIQSVKINMSSPSRTPNCYLHYCILRINTGLLESLMKSAKGRERQVIQLSYLEVWKLLITVEHKVVTVRAREN
jgi:hypothetical protein